MKKKISTMALVAVLATAAATTPVYASIQYPDINGHWSKNIVEKWAEANVVSGYPDGTFKPNDNITRAEFGVWVYKLFGYQPSSKDSKFADDKIGAYVTLYRVLTTVIKVAAPFVPFITENIYQNLVVGLDKNAEESIHLCKWPEVDEKAIDKELEKEMDLAYTIVKLGRSARNGQPKFFAIWLLSPTFADEMIWKLHKSLNL